MRTTELLLKTGFLHNPMWLSDYEKGDISKIRAKSDVFEEVGLTGEVSLSGRGSLSTTEHGFRTESELHLNEWAPEQQPDGDYCNFGQTGIRVVPEQTDWRKFTRLRFSARAAGIGNRSPHIYVHLKNTGEVPMPDEFYRTGTHQISLVYGEWVDCIWEIAELPRDRITEVEITLSLNGSDNEIGKTAALEIKDLRLQVSEPYCNAGWECTEPVSYSQSGYRLHGKKTAVTMLPCKTFSLEAEDGTLTEFAASTREFLGKTYTILDFSGCKKAGRYRIVLGASTLSAQHTAWFNIRREPFSHAALRLCNFIFCERCGYPIPTKHGICHDDITVTHGGRTLIYNGGWHDAGDMSQQTLQTGEIASALYHAADAANRDDDELLADRLYEEARWGMAFLLKTRFGDGYRATSAGLTRYTHGFLGDMDDVTARCHNNPFENFLLSAIESDAAVHEQHVDESLSDQLWQAAKEDFEFAVERLPYYKERKQSFFEHSYASSYSLHLAAAIYAGCNLLTRGWTARVEDLVKEYVVKLLACQETTDRYAVSGFFYRDTDKKIPVHFNHQSREYLFAKALSAAYYVLDGEEKRQVYQALSRYADYYRGLMRFASPYGMIPAGLHLLEEAEDRETFPYLHLAADYDAQKDNMIEQIKQGVPAGEGAYIRQFPVWFSFRGNSAVLLSQGMACRILSEVLEDEELGQIADEQMYFICGRNPFAQSLIYGEGSRYAPQYAAQPGQMVGEIPVGIETDGNLDVPFYPEAVNATYKEVWTSPAARFLGSM